MSVSNIGGYRELSGDASKVKPSEESVIPVGMAEGVIVRTEASRCSTSHMSERSVSYSPGSSPSFACSSGSSSPPEQSSPEFISLSDEFKEKVLAESIALVIKNLSRQVKEKIGERFASSLSSPYQEKETLEKELEAAFQKGIFLEDILCGVEYELGVKVRNFGTTDQGQWESYFDQIQELFTDEEQIDLAQGYYAFSKSHVRNVAAGRVNKGRLKVYKASSRAL